MLRQQMARNTMGESLLNSIVTSMLRTDYIRSLYMDDTFRSYVTICSLHLYPILLRLQQFPNEEVGLMVLAFRFYVWILRVDGQPDLDSFNLTFRMYSGDNFNLQIQISKKIILR